MSSASNAQRLYCTQIYGITNLQNVIFFWLFASVANSTLFPLSTSQVGKKELFSVRRKVQLAYVVYVHSPVQKHIEL